MAVPKFFEFLPVALASLVDGSEKAVKQIRLECIEQLSVST